MYKEQYHAGFVLSAVHEAVNNSSHETIKSLIKKLCDFDLEVSKLKSQHNAPAIFSVADNIVSRGQPTLTSCLVEQHFASSLRAIRELDEDLVNLSFECNPALEPSDIKIIERVLAIIDPRFSSRLETITPVLEGSAEPEFFRRALPTILGHWACQLFEPQREVSSILHDQAEQFLNQRVDFALDLPPTKGQHAGFIVEIDGQQHKAAAQESLDRKRDSAFTKADWVNIRIDASDAHCPPKAKQDELLEILGHPFVAQIKRNWEEPLWEDEEGRKWMQMLLSPILIARVQKSILQLILSGHLNSASDVWRIAIIERDLPGAHLAIADLHALIAKLAALEGRKRTIPSIELRLYRTNEFKQFELAQGYEAEIYSDKAVGILDFDADVLIDVSILQRPGFSVVSENFRKLVSPKGLVATIRTSHSSYTKRHVSSSCPINYVGFEENDGYEVLTYFLQNIFRKRSFREKQIEAIIPALKGESVLALLPTGAGKSICYQLPALLQPGITLVVDPLKSLMNDQYDNLNRAGIDSAAFINSSLNVQMRERFQIGMLDGNFQFVFVSPERFLIREFRHTLHNMKVGLAYLVVDEAHCVSEWGHDFRTAYLRLGQNARDFCRTNWLSGHSLPILALTGTASFDVLADVKRELNLDDTVASVKPDSFERKNLSFEIVHVSPPQMENETDYWTIRDAVINQKYLKLFDALEQISHTLFDTDDKRLDVDSFFTLKGKKTRSGIVFTPHANGGLGVQKVRRKIENNFPSLSGLVGCYASSDKEVGAGELDHIQGDFKSDQLSMLVATKAFGMGIDKPNIRYIIHLALSQSIESYYQEAGRAGRDGRSSKCYLLYCDQPMPNEDGNVVSFDRDLMLFFHNNSFKGADVDLAVIEELLTRGATSSKNRSISLDALLNQMNPSQKHVVVIPFANDIASEISQRLRGLDPRITPGIVSSACGKANGNVDEFISQMRKRLGENNPKTPDFEKDRLWLKDILLQHRDDAITFKAVYRLTTISLIEDYEVDYSKKIILATICKHEDGKYIQALRDYATRYVSPESIRNLERDVLASSANGVIRATVKYLVNFVYDNIAKKREEAINSMEDAVREGIKHGSSAFQLRINTYFDSRYTEELRGRLGPQMANYDLPFVLEFMDKTAGVVDNLQHLRGACDRLLATDPDNGALLLLRAFTRCMLSHDDTEEFSSEFQKGWEVMRKIKGVDWLTYIGGVSDFYRHVAKYDEGAVGPITQEISRIHTVWTKSYNDKILEH